MIDDMALLRHGGIRQLGAITSRFLVNLAHETSIVPAGDYTVFVDVDDTIIEVHGHRKQGAGFGYSGVRRISALHATVSTVSTVTGAPVIVGQPHRKAASGFPEELPGSPPSRTRP